MNPSISTLIPIVNFLGGSFDEVFAESKAVVADSSIKEIKEEVDVVTAEKDLTDTKNKMLEEKVAALTLEVELLKKELLHKDELLALHNYYNKINK
jgi:hypothetical protein